MTTPLSEIDKIHASLSPTFLASLSSTKPSPPLRIPSSPTPTANTNSSNLARLTQENADALCHSLWLGQRGSDVGEDVKLEGWQEV